MLRFLCLIGIVFSFYQALGQECEEWELSLSLPRSHSDFSCDSCVISGTRGFLAADTLQILDITSIDEPSILSELDPPGTITEIQVQDDLVKVLTDAGVLMLVDCSDPTAPVARSTFEASTSLNSLVPAGSLLAVGGEGVGVLLFDPDQVGELDILGSIPGARTPIGFCAPFLIVSDGYSIMEVWDIEDPGSPQLVSDYEFWTVGPIGATVVGRRILAPYQVQNWEYEYFAFRVFELGQDGSLSSVWGMSLPEHGNLAYKAPWVTLATDSRNYLLDPETLEVAMVYPSGKLAHDDNMVALARGDEGLILWDGFAYGVIQPQLVFSNRERFVNKGNLVAAYDVEYSDEGLLGGYRADCNYDIYDLSDPLDPLLLVSGSESESSWDLSPFAYVRLLDNDTYFTDSGFDVYSSYCFRTIPDDEVLGYLTSTGFPSPVLVGDVIWLCIGDPAVIESHHLDPEEGLEFLADFAVDDFNGIELLDGEILLGHNQLGLKAFDVADPLNMVSMGQVDMPLDRFVGTKGRVAYFLRNGKLFGASFQDPSSPEILQPLNLDRELSSMVVQEPWALFFYSGGCCQIGKFRPDGVPYFVSPVIEGNFSRGVIHDFMAYLYSPGQGIQLFDIHGPSVPKYVGTALGSSRSMHVIDGYLVSGGRVFAPDCLPTTATPEVVSQDVLGLVRASVELAPNPFNPVVRLKWGMTAPGNVSVAVYDMRGHRLSTLYDGWKDSGSHELVWDGKDAEGRDLSSGIYLFRVVSGNQEVNKKAVLVR